MNSWDEALYPPKHVREAKHAIYKRLNFHDLNLYSQTNQVNNKSVAEYFEANHFVVEYFKNLHGVMTASNLDPREVWALAKVGATYDPKVQGWILNYAVQYLKEHYLSPPQKKISPHFHQWVYIIRSFQRCNSNFNADLFINKAIEEYLLLFNPLEALSDERRELKEQGHNFASNPKGTINITRKIRLAWLLGVKKCFAEDEDCNYLSFLFLYRSNLQIFIEANNNCAMLKHSKDGSLLKSSLNLLLMRCSQNELKSMIYRLLSGKNRGTSTWVKRTKIFMEIYDGWEFNSSFADEEMRRGIEELKNLMITWRLPLISPNVHCNRAKNPQKKRHSSRS